MGESEDWEDRKWFNNEDKTTIKSQQHQRGGAGLVREAPPLWLEPILETALALVLGTGEGAVLTGALAYGLRSSLDKLFANGAC